MAITPTPKDIEYEDAYVIEEKSVNYEDVDYDKIITETHDDLSLDSLDLSEDDEVGQLTGDYDKMKIASEISKRKIENQTERKNKFTEFKPKVIKREEVVEDYIRNFFTKYTLVKTLDEFNVSIIILNNFLFIFMFMKIFLKRKFFILIFLFRKNLMNFPKKENLMTITSVLLQMYI